MVRDPRHQVHGVDIRRLNDLADILIAPGDPKPLARALQPRLVGIADGHLGHVGMIQVDGYKLGAKAEAHHRDMQPRTFRH